MNTKLRSILGGEMGTPALTAILNELVGIAQRQGHITVANKSGQPMVAGDLVAFDGYDATLGAPTVVLADASTASLADVVLSEAIANDAAGVAYAAGVIGGLDTSGAGAVGSKVYLSETTPGGFTYVAPTGAGEAVQHLGVVTIKHASTGAVLFFPGAAAILADPGSYTLPPAGMPAVDMAAAVQASLALADGAVIDGAGGTTELRRGKITLNGFNPTRVLFQADDAATMLGTDNAATKALSNGLTLIVDPDGAGDDTVTFAAAAGTSTSDAAPSTDMSLEADTKLMIAVDGGVATEATFDWATGAGGGPCNDGTKIAAEMQEKIAALGGAFAAVTVAFAGGVYVVTSGTLGTGSSVVITAAGAGNCTEELKLGVADGGVEAAGTGDAANIAAATAAEIADAITAKATGWSAAAVGNQVRITSDTAGKDSSLVVNAGSTADAIIGLVGSAYGGQGLGYASDMGDALYQALACLNGTAAASLGATGLSVTTRTAAGFSVECETTAATEDVDLLIVGVPA
ncbi:MAG: hypothetical protein ACYC6T_08025 [Thermoleophilia bacterium]